MSATRVKRAQDIDPIPYSPQVLPMAIAVGLPGHDFTLQAVMDIKGSMGELSSAVKSLQGAVEKMDARIAKMDDKVSGVTHKLYAAGAVLAVAVVVGGFIVNKAWDLMALQITRSTLPSPANPPPAK